MDTIVEKKCFHLPSFTTFGKKTIKNVKVGYEYYGKLNKDKTNAIFVCHSFSGTSHAAGKYSESDPMPGYWDHLIGPGKALDTNKYFIISADALINPRVNDPNVITTGPASINPDTGEEYGMTFPIITFRDIVAVHKALIDSIGIRKISTIGWSSGGTQALELAASYPELVDKVIAVACGGLEFSAYSKVLVSTWAAPILLDKNWNNGNYYGLARPLAGIRESLRLITFNSRSGQWADKTFGQRIENKNPLDSWDNVYVAESSMTKYLDKAAPYYDANSMLYMMRTDQLFRIHQASTMEEGANRIKAKMLFILPEEDIIYHSDDFKKAHSLLTKLGKSVEKFNLKGSGGHQDGIELINQADRTIIKFLKS